jgi:ABC-type transport system involved in multi-copper enzyme maturation permease subunit
MPRFAVFAGALRYEFAMQVRRKALWIGMLLLSLFVFRNLPNFYFAVSDVSVAHNSVILWTSFVANFFPVGAGLLIADRYTRDLRLRVDETLHTTPATRVGWLAGKYLGVVLATLLPIFLIQMLGAALIAVHGHDATAVAVGVGAFMATLLVSVLFVGAFSLACTTVLPPVLYQFLFVCYWFWGNFLNPRDGIPTLNGTPLTSDGRYILQGFFPVSSTGFRFGVPPGQALESLALLLGCAALALLAMWLWMRWQEDHV